MNDDDIVDDDGGDDIGEDHFNTNHSNNTNTIRSMTHILIIQGQTLM